MVRVRLILLSLLVLAGCAARPEPLPGPQTIDAGLYTPVFDAAVRVLRDHGFRVDRQDHRFGVVTTRPLDSPTLFEPWRHTNASGEKAVQSTFNDLRRTVRVSLEPTAEDDGPLYSVSVRVDLERESWPLRRLDGGVRRAEMFATLREAPVEWQRRGITDHYWAPAGRDPALEQRLLRAIMDQSREITE